MTATAALIRFALRRDRVRLPVWLGAITAFTAVSALSVQSLYPTAADARRYAEIFSDNPAAVAFTSPGYGFDDPDAGVVLVNEVSLWAVLAVALMSIFLVVRHRRAEEESGRAELVRAGVVGRHAPTAATVVVVGGANVAVGVLTAGAYLLTGFGATGSVALAAATVAAGLVFLAVTLLACQVVTTGRGALGIGAATLGVALVLRTVGDLGVTPLRWLSPIGWAQGIRAFAGERWWTLALALGVTVALTAVAVVLEARRDLGGGLVQPRPGPAHAARWWTTPLGFSLRLQRWPIVSWTAGIAVLSAVYGAFGRDMEQMLADDPELADFLATVGGADITDAYFATALSITALLACGFTLASVLRLRSEETSGRVEPLLASPLSRWRWAGSHLAVTVAATVVVVAVGGTATGAAHAAMTGAPGELPRLLGAALVTLPGVLLLGAVATLLVGLAPRAAPAVWALLAVVVLAEVLGELLRLPSWARAVSPFEHLPPLPAAELSVLPLVVVTLLGVTLGAGGLLALRRRDLSGL